MPQVDDPPLERPVPAALRSAATAQLILDIATAAAGERELDLILTETLDRLGTVVPLTGGSIALVEGDDLVIRAAVGPFAGEALGQRLRRGPSRSWTVVGSLEPFMSGDIKAEGLTATGATAGSSIRSWLAVPIVRRGQGIGLVEIDSTAPSAFEEGDVELLSTVVRALAGTIELASHYADELGANVLRDAFVGVISHELRTPITTIYGLTKMLRQRVDVLDPSVRNQAIEDIEAEADRLYRLVEDLLILSRAERGRLEIADEPILPTKVLRHALRAEAARWPTRQFDIDVPGHLPLVLGEATYLEQVVRNLVANAAKYSPAGSRVSIVARYEEGEIRVRVLDAGMGIEPGDEEQLFEIFYRSPTAARQAAGAGIGLFVCRQLVEAMGGRIWARRREEGGSEFGFTLPVHSEEPDAE